MQRAAVEVVLLAPLAGLLGAHIVLRRLAFYTHGVGAAAFPGLVLAGPIGVPPLLAALGVAGGFAALLAWLGRGRGLAPDAATALLLAGALALGAVLASDVFESGAEVDGLLFGSLLAIGGPELSASAAALLAATAAALAFRRGWIAAGFDPAGARANAPHSAWAERALLAAIAFAVVASVDAVGAMLVASLLVIPAATARLFAGSVRSLELGAAGLALLEGLAGLMVAYMLDAPPGPVIATLGGAAFATCLAVQTLRARRPAAAAAPA